MNELKIIGIDEAGRGALCGDMYMAACKLHKTIKGLNDSKKLSPKKREELFYEIKEKSTYLIIAFSPEKIDKYGLSYLLGLGLECFKMHFKDENDYLLFDGNLNYGSGIKTMIKADSNVQSVMAASILAKVSRDKRMLELDKIYSGYDLASNKGYGTKKHIQMIEKLGLSKIHRTSFTPKQILQKSLFD